MFKTWNVASVARSDGGQIRIYMTPPGGSPVDVSYYRGVPTLIQNFASADPFGDATAEVKFPQLTALEDFNYGELAFTKEWSAVDIYWVPQTGPQVKLWEGHVVSNEISSDENSASLAVQCQGALFQLDHYVQLTSFLLKPIKMEALIQDAFDKTKRPHLRTQPLQILWPAGWATKDGHHNKITGFYSRDTGTNGQRPLTGWIQTSLLPLMQSGDQGTYIRWTLLQQFGRQPVLQVRDIFTVDYTMYAGIPGVTMNLTRDATQITKVVYGQGTDLAGTEWHRFRIATDGSRTDYDPLYGDPSVYPLTTTNKNLDLSTFNVEAFTDYGSGFDEDAAIADSVKQISRDKEPGWTGTITLKIDPTECSRYLMRAGKNILMKYFQGSGETGVLFHIAQCEINVQDKTATLTVDTKFRDLLTLEEVIERSRDSHTPSRLLRAGAQSQFFHDIYQPWSYTAGCGFISAFNKPPTAKALYLTNAGTSDVYPYTSLLKKFPPRRYPEYYICVKSNAKDSRSRWTRAQVLVNHAGTIRRTEFACVNSEGVIQKIPFHVSVYSDPVGYESMPMHNGVVSPFLTGAFIKDTSDPNFNQYEQPTASFIIGWGDGDQKAGYWPGLASNGSAATGLLVDEGGWNYDLTQQFSPNKPKRALRTLYLMFYAEATTEPVYFTGRLYRGIEDLPL